MESALLESSRFSQQPCEVLVCTITSFTPFCIPTSNAQRLQFVHFLARAYSLSLSVCVCGFYNGHPTAALENPIDRGVWRATVHEIAGRTT